MTSHGICPREEFFGVWHWSFSEVRCVRSTEGKKGPLFSQLKIAMQGSALAPELGICTSKKG